MLRAKKPETSFYGSYLYDRIVPADHLLRKINAVVDFSFVNELVRDRYTPDFGRPAEDPEFMLRLCLLQYIYGDSDREVEENASMNLAYKYFLGLAVDEEPPDHSTICYFRSIRLGEEKFREVFEKIVQQCIEKGLVTGKRQIIDSTHIEADVARNSLTGIVRLCRRNVIQDVTRQSPLIAERLGIPEPKVRKQDKFARMDEGLEKEVSEARALLDGITSELRRGTLKPTPELARSLELLEKAVADREDDRGDRLVSPVDPDARNGKRTGKSWIGYKGHLVVEEDSEIITAVETTPANKDDGSQLKPLLKQQEGTHSLVPEQLSADKAYSSGANLEVLDSKHINGYVSLVEKFNRLGRDLFSTEDFKYDPKQETLTCPAGCVAYKPKAEFVHTADQKRTGIIFQFSRKLCANCKLKSSCFPHPSRKFGRAVHVNYYHHYYLQMKERMDTQEGKEAYRRRYKVEHKIADLARYCSMRHCRYRGIDRARIHTLLSAIVSNVKRMAKLLWKVNDVPLLEPGMAA
jgi:transposase